MFNRDGPRGLWCFGNGGTICCLEVFSVWSKQQRYATMNSEYSGDSCPHAPTQWDLWKLITREIQRRHWLNATRVYSIYLQTKYVLKLTCKHFQIQFQRFVVHESGRESVEAKVRLRFSAFVVQLSSAWSVPVYPVGPVYQWAKWWVFSLLMRDSWSW